MQKKATGIGLFSGGLDSILSVCVLQQQNIDIIPISFVTPFFGPATAQKSVKQLGLELRIMDITDKHLAMLKNPRYGYGKNMNPCIDCHGLMFNQAGELMQQLGADFIFSGEVLGERPMSQNKNSLKLVANLSGYADYIIRPLSARLLPESLPEKEGLVDRDLLLDIQGRSRKPQLELVKKYNISYYPEPAGGCRLTDVTYSKRLKDLFQQTPWPERNELELLNVGRHVRVDESTKIIIGRNQQENDRIQELATEDDTLLTIEDIPSPTVIITGNTTDEIIELAASMCIRYSDAPPDEAIPVAIYHKGLSRTISATACPDAEIKKMMI